jgi:large subunit ribosomal protein L40
MMPRTSSSSGTRAFSTTAPAAKKAGSGGGKQQSSGGQPAKPRKKHQAPRSEFYARVKTLKQNMFAPAPPPLRMARLRHLRHWTIHRAWLLFRRQQREAGEVERARMQAGMYNACEELRKTVGPGDRGEGYLYRVAMEKKGVWGKSGVPIEYARYQTEYAGATPWNHEWTR